MMRLTIRAGWAMLAAGALLLSPGTASAHFLWLTVEPSAAPNSGAKVRAFLNEEPEAGGPEFLKFVQGVKPTVNGQPLAVTTSANTVDADWVGKLPAFINAERDLGLRTKDGKTHRLYYTARAQTEVVASTVEEREAGFRVRLISKDGKDLVQVLFDGKPVANARIKIYPAEGEGKELTADADGLAEVAGAAEGKTPLWANWVDEKAGELNGKPFTETRYYGTLTFKAQPADQAGTAASAAATTLATMPEPVVNSFGGAVLGDWLYIYSGHVGTVHKYSVDTTSKHFRRFNLKDKTTWEELPITRDLQGLALVTDGRYLYRTGGMYAKNKADEDNDLVSVADFARFDPETKTWTDLAPMPEPRSTHDSVIVGQTIYVVGGWSMKGGDEENPFLKDAAAFDLAHPENGWKTIPQPFQRRALSVAEAGGKLYILGGLIGGGMNVDRKVDVYDPATDKWTTGPALPGKSRFDGFGTSSFGIDGRIYYSGGSGVIYRLTAQGDEWEAIGAWATPRITHRVLPGVNHTLLAVGGNDKGKQAAVIECVELPSTPAVTTVAEGR